MEDMYYCGSNVYHQLGISENIIREFKYVCSGKFKSIQIQHKTVAVMHHDGNVVVKEHNKHTVPLDIKESVNTCFYLQENSLLKANGHLVWKIQLPLDTYLLEDMDETNSDQYREMLNCAPRCIVKMCGYARPSGQLRTVILFSDGTVCELIDSAGQYKVKVGKEIQADCKDTDEVAGAERKAFGIVDGTAVDIAAGLEHVMILLTSGHVLTYGKNSRGQLGQGDVPSTEKPTKVLGLEDVKVVKISAAGWHSCVVTEGGELYTWGWNRHGQLGLPVSGELEVGLAPEPCLVDLPWRVEQVSSGSRHTFILTECQRLLSCGWNEYGQLGLDTNEPTVCSFTEVKLDKPFQHTIKTVICGSWGTAIVLNNNKD